MKRNINFYFDEFKPKTELVSLSNLLILALLMLVLAGTAIWLSKNQLDGAKSKVSQLELAVNNQTILVKEFESALNNRQLDPKLTMLIAELQEKIQIKKQIIHHIEQITDNQKQGYSNLMADLANTMPTGIWLNKINFSDDNIELSGQSLQASSVPKWLQALGHSNYFHNKSFDQLQLNHLAEKNLTEFNVMSIAEQQEAK